MLAVLETAGPGFMGRGTGADGLAAPRDAGPTRARARRPICPDHRDAVTNPVSCQRTHEGAAARVPWSPRCVPRRRPLSPGTNTACAPLASRPGIRRMSTQQKALARASLTRPVRATRPGTSDHDVTPSCDSSTPPTPSHSCMARPRLRGAAQVACLQGQVVRGPTSGAQTMLVPGDRGRRRPGHSGGTRVRAQAPPRPFPHAIHGQ